MRNSKAIQRSINKRFKKLQSRKHGIISVPAMLLAMLLILAVLINTAGATAVAADIVKARVNVETRLNLREEPSLDAKILGKLPRNEVLTVVSQEDGWAKVETADGKSGYVSTDYIIIKNDEQEVQTYQTQGAYNYVGIDKESYELLSTSEISAKNSSKNRNFNMSRASESINGLKLEPGEVFAWYDVDKNYDGVGYIKASGVVGPASKSAGYKEATVISNGKYDKGYGGGVCQVSTALYNAIYKLDIQPIEHNHHSLKSSYVEDGMDATVAYNENQDYRKNFVFMNTKDYPIVFEAYQYSGKVTVRVYRYGESE